MFLSVFELFKIGIGPSSSHTVGPMVAARRFLSNAKAENAARVSVSLHGSLAFTGKGHGTDRACVLGLAGEAPDAIEPDRVDAVVQEVAERKSITLPNGKRVSFDPAKDVIFDYGPALPGHANGMIFTPLGRERRESFQRNLLFHRRRLRADRSGTAGIKIPGPRRGQAQARRALSLLNREGNAGDGQGLRPQHRRDETRQ